MQSSTRELHHSQSETTVCSIFSATPTIRHSGDRQECSHTVCGRQRVMVIKCIHLHLDTCGVGALIHREQPRGTGRDRERERDPHRSCT